MDPCSVGQVCPVRLDEFGDQFRRYRLRMPQAVRRWRSHCRWGQCAPIVATLREEKPQVLDGFTRWEAARQVRGMTTLSVRLIDVDDRRAKAAIYGLNQTGGGRMSWKRRGSSGRWCVRMGCPRPRSPSSWAATRAGSAGGWRCWRSSAPRCVRTWKSGS